MPRIEKEVNGASFLLQWVIATVAGVALGCVPTLVVAQRSLFVAQLSLAQEETAAKQAIAALLLIGATMGFLQ